MPAAEAEGGAVGGAGDRAERRGERQTDARAGATPTMTASRRSSPRSGGGARFGDVPDMTLEEHQRRGEAADALFREIVRRATE